MDELDALRSQGVDVRGVSSHGSQLARLGGFKNWEVFLDCPDSLMLGPRKREIAVRTPEGELRTRLDQVGLSQLGLEYEAYFLPQDLYVSEANGRFNVALSEVGLRLRTSRRRALRLTILTHPVWWRVE
ncbi:MAG: hypothetical protein Kow0056_09840 [Coriobacteriia bacterium]